MKKLFLSAILISATIAGYSQTKKAEAKPFSLSFDEKEANRTFFLINQLKEVVKKSKTPYDEGLVIQANCDTVLLNIQQQYLAWQASQKKDTTTGKK